MMLGDANAPHFETGERATLDSLFRRNAARQPDAVALRDPPNRSTFTDGAPRALTYAQADHIVSAIAGRLRRLGLTTDAPIALQFPNTVESVLMLLGVLRAGMIAVQLPLLWRRADATAALNRVGAKAIVTVARTGATSHCRMARDVAVDVFPVRYVCSFGNGLPDGVMPFDDLMSPAPLLDPAPDTEREGNPAAHIAVVTFEATPDGLMAVARNHTELIAGGRAVQLEARIEDGANILASCGTASFAALSSALLPWLIGGGTLSLHHPFDAASFVEQCRSDGCDTVVVPGPLVTRIAQAGLFTHPELKTILALWRAPERLTASAAWQHAQADLVDIQAFGETALIAAQRGPAGEPAEIPLGLVTSPRRAAEPQAVLETTLTQSGTLAMRGRMVPRHAFPPGARRGAVHCFMPDADGFADTGYPCRADRDNAEVVVTGPPAGIVGVGGYRFKIEQLQDLVGRASPDAILAALPDALAGHRLAGSAPERGPLRRALDEVGMNPLIGAAFSERRRTATP